MDINYALTSLIFVHYYEFLSSSCSSTDNRQQADGIKCKKRSLLIAVGR